MIKQHNDLIIKGVVWINQDVVRPATIGIVMVQNTLTNEIKAYVGTGMGHNEDSDIVAIILHGGKLHPDGVKRLFEHFGGEINSDIDWKTALRHLKTQVYPKDIFPEPTLKQTNELDEQHKKYLTAASGSMARTTCELVLGKVLEIRKLRAEANEDRGEPDKHPSKTEGDIDG